jgi:pantetheine-phosphate adenylyltransferase
MPKRVGLYPGTFDPMTNGHMDIIKRAAKLVDRLVIGVAINEAKKPLFTLEERVEMLRYEAGPLTKAEGVDLSVEPFDTLLMYFAEKVGATIIIRGLRAVSDFEYEFQMVGMNMKLAPEIENVFLMADAQYQAINSRLVKEICSLGGDISHFTTPYVAQRLAAKFPGKAMSGKAPKVVALKQEKSKP